MQKNVSCPPASHPNPASLQVFAPLARLLGLYSIKEELEELAFGYSMPEEYTPLRLHLEQLAKEQGPMVQQVCYPRAKLSNTPEPRSTSLGVDWELKPPSNYLFRLADALWPHLTSSQRKLCHACL